MLVIRLARTGRSKYPTYRIVAAESARAATGKFIEVLGHYNPHTKELVIQKERVQERLSKGAQPSNTVVKLLQREKLELPGWVELKTRERKPKSEPEVKAEVKAEAPADEAAADDATSDDEVRVAEAATENAAETEDKATPAGKTETGEDTDAAADAAKEAEDAGAEAADNAASEAAPAEGDAAGDADKS